MNDELLDYYKRELAFVRNRAGEFAQDNPDVADQLRLKPESGGDPHVERMISAFAFLTARVRQKLDDDLPEIAHALMGMLYPHYLAPIPSMAIVELQLKPDQGALTDGYPIGRGQELETEPVGGEPCRYRTCYATRLWPINLVEASLGSPIDLPQGVQKANTMLRLRLKCFANDMTFAKLKFKSDRLRFYLHGQANDVFALYELVFGHLLAVTVSSPGLPARSHVLGKESVRPVGFEEAEGLLPFGARSLPGYRLLTEYFVFPQKFCFLELTGLTDDVCQSLGHEIELRFYLDRSNEDLRHNVSASMFRLGCTPVINLFRQRADPIRLSHEETEYRVLPDRRKRPDACEVYSIQAVTGISPDGSRVEYQPLYSLKHSVRRDQPQAFWLASRRFSSRTEHQIGNGTEVYLALVDLAGDALRPASIGEWKLDVETECLNRDLPAQLPSGGNKPGLVSVDGGPLSPIACLTPPTPTRRPPLGRGVMWRLISHLSLGHLSIAGKGESTDALREILKLYDFSDSPETQARIDGIVEVKSSARVGRVQGSGGSAVCRGIHVVITFDEERYADNGLFLFASVLEKFLELYAAVNSFIQLSIRSQQSGRLLRTWRPRGRENLNLD